MRRDTDTGSETRLFRRARDAGMTRTEAIEKRLTALYEHAERTGLRSDERAILEQHVIAAANTVWPDQATTDFLRRQV